MRSPKLSLIFIIPVSLGALLACNWGGSQSYRSLKFHFQNQTRFESSKIKFCPKLLCDSNVTKISHETYFSVTLFEDLYVI